jgi:hypothetical protein
MGDTVARRIREWRMAWVCLAIAIAIHVTDEALSGFLPVYNEAVLGIRARIPWAPIPTFTFPVWLAGLAAGVVLLLLLTPQVSRHKRWIRIVSLILGVVMVGNALGHLGASVYQGRLMPGVYSAPLLLAAAIALLVTAWRARRAEEM